MENNKIAISFLKLIIVTGVILCGVIALLMMIIHINYLPNTFNLLIRESIFIISSIGFFILAKKHQMKVAKICCGIIIMMGIVNLLGFNLLTMLL